MKKTEPFVKMPPGLIFDERLSPIDVRIYAALRSHRRENTRNDVWPARKTLADRLGCSLSTVDRSIKALCSVECISYVPGKKGRSNRYQFHDDISYQHRVTHDAIPSSQVKSDSIMGDSSVTARVTPQPESYNQNHKPEGSVRLFHGGDVCSVDAQSGSVRINAATGWVDWSNYGVEDFRFGNLQGEAALKAARKRFCDSAGQNGSNPGMVSPVAHDRRGSNPNRSPTSLIDNLNND